jgi:hypothetical protein
MFKTTSFIAAAVSLAALYTNTLITSASPALVQRAAAPPDPFTQVFTNLSAAVEGGDFITFNLVDTIAGECTDRLRA